MNLAILEAIYEYVGLHPGCSQYAVRQALGLTKGDLPGRLASMERAQLKLCEHNGMLFPHSRYGVLAQWFLGEMYG